MFQHKCDLCGEEVKPADTQIQLTRNIAMHNKYKHGISSKGYIPVHLRPDHPKFKPPPGTSPAKLAQMEQARKAKQLERARAKAMDEASKVRPLELKSCPKCGAEFLQRIKGRISPMLLSNCSACRMRFYYAQDPAPLNENQTASA